MHGETDPARTFEEPVIANISDADMFDLLGSLQDVAKTLRMRWDRELRVAIADMNAARASVLMQLAKSGGSSQVRLARLLGLNQMALTRVLNDLERLGWVQREPVPADRRAWAVRLTSGGREKLTALHGKAHEFARRYCTGLDEDRLAAFVATLARMKALCLSSMGAGNKSRFGLDR